MSTAGTIYERDIKYGHAKLIVVANAASSASLNFSPAVLTTEFDTYLFDITDLRGTSPGGQIAISGSNDGGATLVTGQALYSFQYTVSAINSGAMIGSTLHSMSNNWIIASAAQAASQYVGGEITWTRRSPTNCKNFTFHTVCYQDPSNNQVVYVGGGMFANQPINALQFNITSGTIASGRIKLYGLRTGA